MGASDLLYPCGEWFVAGNPVRSLWTAWVTVCYPQPYYDNAYKLSG
jgi:hypothetical protein